VSTVVLGTGPLKDLSLALFVGTAAGTYSSIFIATPLAVQLKERETLVRTHAKRVLARRTRGASTPPPVTDGAEPVGVAAAPKAPPAPARKVGVSSAAKRSQPQRSTRSARNKGR